MSEWISVVERKPPTSVFTPGQGQSPQVYVLVCDTKARMAVAWFYGYQNGSVRCVSGKAIGEVTHWMPLPSPPSAEKEER